MVKLLLGFLLGLSVGIYTTAEYGEDLWVGIETECTEFSEIHYVGGMPERIYSETD